MLAIFEVFLVSWLLGGGCVVVALMVTYPLDSIVFVTGKLVC